MPFAKLLRTVLGLGSSDSGESSDSTDVTVERETDEAATEDVGGVGGGDVESSADEDEETGVDDESVDREETDVDESVGDEETEEAGEPSTGVDEAFDEDADADDSAAAATDATASTDSMTEVPDEPTEAAEPAEAAGQPTGETEVDVEADESTVDAEADESTHDAEAEEPAAEGDARPVDEVSGIGPAYAQRLADVGIETVQDLLDADPEAVADETDLGAGRVRNWQERAADA